MYYRKYLKYKQKYLNTRSNMIEGIPNIINMYGGTIKIELDTEKSTIKIDDMLITYKFNSQQRSIDPSDIDTIVTLTITDKKKYDEITLTDILNRLSKAKAQISDINLIIAELRKELAEPIEPKYKSLDEIKINPIMIHTTNNSIKIDDMIITYKFDRQQRSPDPWDTDEIVTLNIVNLRKYDDTTLTNILNRLSKAKISNINLIIAELRSKLKLTKMSL